LEVDFFIEIFLSLFGLCLDLLLYNDITEEHLAMKSLDHILIIMEHLVSFLEIQFFSFGAFFRNFPDFCSEWAFNATLRI
jgi:hypothetical protein